MYRILVVDDEEKIRLLIRKYAEFEGHSVFEATDGMQAVQMCKTQNFDIIVLDIMMPFLDGMSACTEIRKFCNTPIIMLTARGEEYDKIGGFHAGADDYVVKPFSPKVLMLKIDAILRRVNGSDQRHEVFNFEDLSIDFTARVVKIEGKPIDLTPKEIELLFYLVKNKGIALTREKLICEVWGYDFYKDDRTLDTHIKLLRKSLGKYNSLITTLRGVGYRFDCQ